MTRSQYSAPGSARILVLSLMRLFFAIPHTLEDFALGEPAKAGVSAPVLSFAIALMIALQAVGIYWLGQGLRRGALVHVLPDWMYSRYTVYAALPTRRMVPARTKAFLDFVTEQVPEAVALQRAAAGLGV